MKKLDIRFPFAIIVLFAFLGTILLFADFRETHEISISISEDNPNTITIGETYYLSEEEFSPVGNSITLSVGQGAGDRMVILVPVECKEENSYEPTYITPGLPVKMEVEKGAWFKVGLNGSSPASNTTFVTIEGVTVRIS